MYITEVMNSSFFLDPYSPNVWRYWMAFNDFQYDHGGDPFVGAKLGNLLLAGGQLSAATLTTIRNAITTINPGSDWGRKTRVWSAIVLVMACPEYLVQK